MGCAYETAGQQQQKQQQKQQQQKQQQKQCDNKSNNQQKQQIVITNKNKIAKSATTTTTESNKHKNNSTKDIKIKDNYQQKHKKLTTATTTTTISSKEANLKVAQVLIFRPTREKQQQKQHEQENEVAVDVDVAACLGAQDDYKDTKYSNKNCKRIATFQTKNIEPQAIDTTINDLQTEAKTTRQRSRRASRERSSLSTTTQTTQPLGTTTTTKSTTICHTHTKINTNSLTNCHQRTSHAYNEPQQQQQQQQQCCNNAARNMAATLAAACIGGGFGSIHEMLLHARAALATQLSIVSGILSETTTLAKQQQQHNLQQQQQQHRQVTHKPQQSKSKQLQPADDDDDDDDLPLPPELLLDEFNSCAATKCRINSSNNSNNNNNNLKSNRSPNIALSATLTTTTNLSALTFAPNAIANALSATAAATTSAAYNYFGHHNNNNNSSSNSSSNNNNYYNMLRNSFSFYAASSVILVLCYLTTTTSAATTNSDAAPLDKHPIHGIDWSKFDESSSDKEILDLLLEKKRYDKRLLPPVNGTLTVNVNVLLLSLASPDESSLKYEVEFLLNQQWNDPRLQYGNKSHYDFLNALHHHDSIWTPDTYFIMHGDFKDPIIPMHFALRIYRNGTITYAMRRHLILSCQGSLHIFPFDDPKCSFSMESISYEEAQIKYVWKNDEDTLRKSPSLTTLNAYLIKNQTTPCDQNSWRGNYSCLRVDLIFTRDRAFYFTTVFIPGIILVTSSFITFWLEWNAVPARSMIGVTTMLNFFTTSNGFRSTLPVVSNLTAMNVWDGVCMCFIYASLLEFVCVNYVGRKRPLHNVVYRPGENPVTQRLPAVLSRIGVILASPLEIIEREFHAALSSEKASAGPSAMATPMASTAATTPGTPLHHQQQQHHMQQQQQQQQQQLYGGMRWEEAHGGIIGAAVQHLRARSIKRKSANIKREGTAAQATTSEPIYAEPDELAISSGAHKQQQVSFKVTDASDANADVATTSGRCRTMATNTPPLITRGEASSKTATTRIEIQAMPASETADGEEATLSTSRDIEMTERQLLPLKPPRKKSSRSNSPAGLYEAIEGMPIGGTTSAGIILKAANLEQSIEMSEIGEKRREAGAPNEIVACTTCGGSNSPCTHSANNGCATETCFVQVRKKEPPHPIRVAKTIDVIARITFPTAYSIFLIFFFVHYKGFS